MQSLLSVHASNLIPPSIPFVPFPTDSVFVFVCAHRSVNCKQPHYRFVQQPSVDSWRKASSFQTSFSVQAQVNEMASVQSIIRVASLDEFLAAAKLGEKPVVYNLKENERFPCHSKWTNEYLETIDTSVGIHRATQPSFFDFTHSPVE